MITIFLFILSVFIDRFVKGRIGGYIIAASTLGVLIVIYIIRFILKRTTQLLIIVLILTYNIFRLVLLKVEFGSITPLNYFYGGYNYAILYAFLIKSLPSTFYRIFIVVIAYVFRLVFVGLVIDNSALQVGFFIRGALVDLFIIYYFHSGEKIDRKVFLNFDEKREELLKFKELLADSLPLGITIVHCQSLKYLFSNSAYQNLVHNSSIGIDTFPTGSWQ